MKGFLRFMTYPGSKRDGWMYFFFWGSGEFGINAAGLAGLGKGGGFFYSIFFLGLRLFPLPLI